MTETTRVRALLFATSLTWGTSFLFIDVAVRDMTPAFVAASRLGMGAVTLWLFLLATRRAPNIARAFTRTSAVPISLVGLLTALPFVLMGLGQQRIDSSIAGMINSSVPLYVSLLALFFVRSEVPDRRRFIGLAIGFVGVVIIALSRGIDSGTSEVVGIVLVTLASLSYAIGALITRARLPSINPIAVATLSITVAALVMFPFIIRDWPSQPPSWPMVMSIVLLGIVATAGGVALYYTLLARAGAATAATVNYLLPVWATIWGVTLLGEKLYPVAMAGLVLILAGTWVASRRIT